MVRSTIALPFHYYEFSSYVQLTNTGTSMSSLRCLKIELVTVFRENAGA